MKQVTILITLLACCTLFQCCVTDAVKEDQLEQVSGMYSLTHLTINNKEVNLNRMTPPEVLSAELYSSDNKWYFDCVLPDTDYHDGFEYTKLVLPLTWNTALGRIEFDLSDFQVFPKIDTVIVDNGSITVETSYSQDIFNVGRIMNQVHIIKGTWGKQ